MELTINRNGRRFRFTMTQDGQIKVQFNNGKLVNSSASKTLKGEWVFDVNKTELKKKFPKMNLLVASPDAEKWLGESRRLAEDARVASYSELVAQLPAINFPESTPDQEKYNTIISKINTQYFSGREDENLNLSVQSQNEQIRREASQYCEHNWEIKFEYTLTADARRKVTRTATCLNCGTVITDSAEEKAQGLYND